MWVLSPEPLQRKDSPKGSAGEGEEPPLLWSLPGEDERLERLFPRN